eukprot:1933582-Rhodomonas_salina.1
MAPLSAQIAALAWMDKASVSTRWGCCVHESRCSEHRWGCCQHERCGCQHNFARIPAKTARLSAKMGPLFA